MVRETGSLTLKNGFGEITEDRSFVVGIPDLAYKGNVTDFSGYLKLLLNSIRATPASKLEPSHLLETAYDKIFKSSKEFSGGHYSDGFLYPKKYRPYYDSSDGLYRVIEDIEDAAKTRALIHVGYRSARRGYSGEPILVNRPYVGRVYKITEDKKSFQLKIGPEDYRNFRIAELQWFGNFKNEHADGVMGHLQLIFTPMPGGRVLLRWQAIEGENSPLLTEPWHQPLDHVEKQLLKQENEIRFPKEEELLESQLADLLENQLKEAHEDEEDELIPFKELRDHYGSYVRIDVLQDGKVVEEIHMRLLATHFYPRAKELKLRGEGGIELYAAVDKFKFYDLDVD